MGAIPHAGGTTLRVRAPHPEAVEAEGSCGGGDPRPLASEGNGYRSAVLPGAGPGDRYRYRITAGGEVLWRLDSCARLVTHSAGEGAIVDLSRRRRAPFQMLGRHDLVVHEVHVGTCNDLPGSDPGRFRTAAEKLPHPAALGVNVLMWLEDHRADGLRWGRHRLHPRRR
ncbi:MAG: hypothetical protein ABIJ48_06005 [Actinomycetota bacterium]